MMMNTVLWIMQVVIAFMFVMAGWKKLSTPKRLMVQQMPQMEGKSLLPFRILGFLELLVVPGLFLPLLLHVLPVMTAVTAICTALVMVGAIPLHLGRKEYKAAGMNVMLLLMSVLVVIYRW